MFEEGDQILLSIPKYPEVAKLRENYGLPMYYLGTFMSYRTAEEMVDWRPQDNCWVFLENQGRVCYPSSWLTKLTSEQVMKIAALLKEKERVGQELRDRRKGKGMSISGDQPKRRRNAGDPARPQ